MSTGNETEISKKKYNRLALRFIGIILFIYLLTKVNFSEILSLFYDIKIEYFLFSCLLFILMLIFKGMRWRLFLLDHNPSLKLKRLFSIYLIGNFFGNITPGRAGELFKIVYINKEGISLGKSFFSVFLDRLCDLVLVSVLGIIGVLFFLDNLSLNSQYLFSAVLLLSSIILGLILLLKGRMKLLLIGAVKRLIPKSVGNKVVEVYNDVLFEFGKITKKTVLLSIILSLIAYLSSYLYFYFLAVALTIKISFFHLLFTYALISLVVLIPISISGIGTRDFVLISSFALVGLTSESAIALSMAELILMNYLLCGTAALIAWLVT